MKRSIFAAVALVSLAGLGLAVAGGPARAEKLAATMWKSPACGCCGQYVDYLREKGYEVRVKNLDDVEPIKRFFGLRPDLESCHTMLIGGYVVEGHVPIELIQRLLDEKPAIRGISLPGMPTGVPGMPGEKEGPLIFYTIEPTPKVFHTE